MLRHLIKVASLFNFGQPKNPTIINGTYNIHQGVKKQIDALTASGPMDEEKQKKLMELLRQNSQPKKGPLSWLWSKMV